MYFKVLETKNSEANERKIFSKKCTTYTPDFFITFSFMTLIISSCFLDLFLVIFLYNKTNLIIWILLFFTSYIRLAVEFLLEIHSPKPPSDFFQSCFKIMLMILGLHSIPTSAEILKESFENPSPITEFLNCRTYPIFHISSENLSLIKFYCYIYTGSKCIPQLFIMSIFIRMSCPTGILAYMSTISLILNMVLFAFTMSITLPIRKKPRIYDNFFSIIFNALNKFLATFSGCCVNMLVFMVAYRHVKFYAFLAHFLKTVIWVLPCQALLSTQPISKLEFFVLMAFFPLIFSFIFIHPFEKKWRLFYYLSYLITSMMDLAFLGIWGEAELMDLSYYSTLRVVQLAFMSFFGMINSLNFGKECELRKETNENEIDEPNEPKEIQSQEIQTKNARETKNQKRSKTKSKGGSKVDFKSSEN